MNVDRWFAIKFPEAYQKSLKTHHTWFIVGAWWLLALIPDLPLWFVPNFSSYLFPLFPSLVHFFLLLFFSGLTSTSRGGWRTMAATVLSRFKMWVFLLHSNIYFSLQEVWMWFKTATCFVIPSLIIIMIWVSLARTLRTEYQESGVTTRGQK